MSSLRCERCGRGRFEVRGEAAYCVNCGQAHPIHGEGGENEQ